MDIAVTLFITFGCGVALMVIALFFMKMSESAGPRRNKKGRISSRAVN